MSFKNLLDFKKKIGSSLLCHFALELAWSLEFNEVGAYILGVLGQKLGQILKVLEWEVEGHK
jgi:hypothetical protein